jgi:hypothetical protein
VKRLALTAFALLAAWPAAQTIQKFLKANTVRWNTPTEPFRILGNIYITMSAPMESLSI